MDLKLDGKVAIVNGASSGIGLAIAQTLAAEGAKVVMAARREDRLRAAAETLRAQTGGAELVLVAADVRRADDCARIVEHAAQAFGRIDILINNDGAPPIGGLDSFDDGAWDKAVTQNLYSVIRMTRATVPHMKGGGGSIVNITALNARQPLPGLGLSVATWAGVLGFAKTLSLELGPDHITVNTICPGRIDTGRLELVTRKRAEQQGRDPGQMMAEMLDEIPLRRLGTPDEVAGLVALLVSARGGFITGTAIQVDGGLCRSLY